MNGEGLAGLARCEGHGAADSVKVIGLSGITHLNAGGEIHRLRKLGIPLTGNGEGHNPAFKHFHGIHAEDGLTAAVQNGTGARWLQNFTAFRVITEGYREGFSTLINAVNIGLHGEGLGHFTGCKGQGTAGSLKIIGFGSVIGLDAGGKVHGLLEIRVARASDGKHHHPALNHFS